MKKGNNNKQSQSKSLNTANTQESQTSSTHQEQPQILNSPYSVPESPVVFLRAFPQEVYCPSCDQQVRSKLKYVPGTMACVLAFMLLFCCCFCGCCLIPFCTKACKDVEHRCSKCNTYIGTYERSLLCDRPPAPPPTPTPSPTPTSPQNININLKPTFHVNKYEKDDDKSIEYNM